MNLEAGQQAYQAFGMSAAFFSVLRGCQHFLAGKDDKGDRFCRSSVQWTNQNKRIRLFDYLPDHLVSWLDSHPSSGRVSSPSITTSISYAWYD